MKPPTASQQRIFGVAIAAALLMLAWIAWRGVGSAFLSGGLVAAAMVVAMVYYLFPASQPKLMVFFHTLTFPIRWTATIIILAIVYYGVVTPIAIWFRLSGKSIRKADPDAASNSHRLTCHRIPIPTSEPFDPAMTTPDDPSNLPDGDNGESFDSIADGADPGILREFIWFVKYNKKWWLTPIIVVLLLLVVLAFVTNSPAAPFIYTLF